MLNILVALTVSFSLSCCEKSSVTTSVYYDETYCADPWWGSSIPVDDKTENVKEYFGDKGIIIFNVEVIGNGTVDVCYHVVAGPGKG